MSIKSEDEQIWTGMGFLREEIESPDLNGRLPVGRQRPEGRKASKEGNIQEALCQGFPLYKLVRTSTFKLPLWNTLLRCASLFRISHIYIVPCLWAARAGQAGLQKRKAQTSCSAYSLIREGTGRALPHWKEEKEKSFMLSGLTFSDTEDDVSKTQLLQCLVQVRNIPHPE